MAKEALKPLTADILTPEIMLEHRVVFFSGTPDSVKLQTDGEVSAAREKMLSALLHCTVSLRKVENPAVTKTQQNNRDAFYHVLGSCEITELPRPNEAVLSMLVRSERAVFHELKQPSTVVFLTDGDATSQKKIDRMEMLLGSAWTVELVFVGSDSEWFDAFYVIIEAANAPEEATLPTLAAPEEEAPAPRRLPNRRKTSKIKTVR